jgi:PAS domain S-box-containing protein
MAVYRVLYVDDEPGLLEIGKIFLEQGGQFTVDTVDSAPEALALLEKTKYDAIIADYQMPGMNGIAFLKKVRISGNTIPFILFTGRGREEIVIQALNEGADFYLQKGGDPMPQFAELSHKVRQAIQKRMAEALLLESQKQLRTVVDSIQVGIVIIDAATHCILSANPKAVAMIGEDPDKIIGHVCHRFICPAQNGSCPVTDLGQQVDLSERVLLDVNGNAIPILKSVVPSVFDGKEVLIESFFDIGGQEQSKNTFPTLIRSMVGGTGIDSLNTITTTISRWLGADIALILEIMEDRKTCQLLSLQPWSGAVPPDPIPLENSPCGLAAERGFFYCPDNFTAKFPRFRTPSGLEPQSYVGTALRDSAGQVIGTLCIFSARPIAAPPQMREILEIIGIKAAAEIEHRKAQRALRESEEKYRELVENANCIILKWDKRGNITFFNEFAQRFFGYLEKEIIGKSVMGTIVPETESGSGRNLQHMIEEIIRDPENHIFNENENITRDGRRVWIRWQNKPLFDKDGEFIGQLCIGNDNTERKKAQEALARSEELYRILAEESPDQIVIYDRDTRIQYVNSAAMALLQLPRDRIIGNPVMDVFPPGISGALDGALKTVFETGRSSRGEDVIQSGNREVWIDTNLVPLTDKAGNITSVLGISHDITGSKNTEDALRKSRHQLAEAMDIAALANWEFDAATGLFTFDDRFYALYGTTAKREGGMQMSPETYTRKFIHPDDQYLIRQEVEKALKTTDPAYQSLVEHRILRRDGAIRHIIVHIRVNMDAEGRVTGTHGANQDITDRKIAEEAFRQANKKLNLLSSITRHDINNQLLSLEGFVGLLQQQVPGSSTEKYFTRIGEAGKNIFDMIQFTKEYEKIGTEAPVWQEVTAVINTGVKGILPGQVILKNTLPARMEVFADPMLEKVFFNLLDNAVRHGGHVTEIRISSRNSGSNLDIVWEDNGIGVPARDKDRIFEQGFGKNTGLGMFLTREILSLTGITITETGEPGKGARFEILVPMGMYRVDGA